MKDLNQIILNILIATLSFLLVYYFNETRISLKEIETRMYEIKVQLKEIQTKEMQYVTELRVIELIKEHQK